MPSMRLTAAASLAETSAGRAKRRMRLESFFSARWELMACRRRKRPLPVTLKRLAAPRSVFCLGIQASTSRLHRSGRRPGFARATNTGCYAIKVAESTGFRQAPPALLDGRQLHARILCLLTLERAQLEAGVGMPTGAGRPAVADWAPSGAPSG